VSPDCGGRQRADALAPQGLKGLLSEQADNSAMKNIDTMP
jgi:hypothetical protein